MVSKLKNIIIAILLFAVLIMGGSILLDRIGGAQPDYTSSAIFDRIVQVRELSLIEYRYTSVAGFEESRTVGELTIPLTKKHFLVKFDGYIKAGIDFDEIEIELQDDRVAIALPASRVLDNVIDEGSIVVYDESMNILNPIRIDDYNSLIIQEKTRMEQEAVRRGILDKAAEEAEILIRAMVADMGFASVVITRQ